MHRGTGQKRIVKEVPAEQSAVESKLLSETIREEFAAADGSTVGDLLSSVKDQGFGLLFVILSIPVAIPVTPPGLSVPFGILVIGLAIQLYLGKETPWVPAWIARRPLKSKPDSKFVRFMVGFVRFFEKFTSPRWSHLFNRRVYFTVIGPIILFAGIMMLVPLPGASWLPSTGVFLIGMGMIERDGKFVMTGNIVGLVGSLITLAGVVAMFYFGIDAVSGYINNVKHSVVPGQN